MPATMKNCRTLPTLSALIVALSSAALSTLWQAQALEAERAPPPTMSEFECSSAGGQAERCQAHPRPVVTNGRA